MTVTVTPVNDAPVAHRRHASTSRGRGPGRRPPTSLANDTDPDGDALDGGGRSRSPPNGTVSLNRGPDVTYTPSPNFTGTDTFTYTVSDGNGGSDTAR